MPFSSPSWPHCRWQRRVRCRGGRGGAPPRGGGGAGGGGRGGGGRAPGGQGRGADPVGEPVAGPGGAPLGGGVPREGVLTGAPLGGGAGADGPPAERGQDRSGLQTRRAEPLR